VNRVRSRLISLTAVATIALLATGCDIGGSIDGTSPAAPGQLPTAAVALSPLPTITPSPTITNTPTPSATPTPTPTPTHPLMIEVMRELAYPASELVFEEELVAGANYERHVVSYQSEGNTIYALLTIPFGQPPEAGWPVVIFNHGYIPPDEYRTTERYAAYMDGFARNGYVVLKSDYRGHGDSEGRPTGGYGTPDYTTDVLNGMASVKRLDSVDPGNIGMWGHSMGGQITLRAMVVSDDIKAGVIWGGVVASYPDLFENFFGRRGGATLTPVPGATPRWRRSTLSRWGSPTDNPEFWASISPNSYLGDISGPIQLHHGGSDQTVPVILSELLAAELEQAGQATELFIYEGSDHNISIGFSLAMQRSIQFFDQHLKQQ